MAKHEELRAIYQEALRLGNELLAVLQGVLTEVELERIESLTEARSALAQRASELFDPALREEFRADLQALLQQQRALEAQMAKRQGELQGASNQAREARGAMEGVRRILKKDQRSRWINEIL